jgi:hypothetical protein
MTMKSITQWHIDVTVVEYDGFTGAEARMYAEAAGERAVGVGHAQVSDDDYDIPEIGAELATARALRDLADQLLRITSDDIKAVTEEDVHLTH